ncbi:5773_t:CDS:2, partial [Racocetra persica]
FDEFNSLSNNTSDSTSKKLKDSLLNQFVLQQYKGASLDKLYYLILKATILNSWSFRWVKNSNSIELFRFINSAIKLSPRRTLSKIILSNASNHLVNEIQQKAQNDIYVLVWQAQDCSEDRVRTNDVKQKIIEIVQSIQDKNIKVASVVTDSYASYQAASNENSDFFGQLSFNKDILELLIHICDSVNTTFAYCGYLNIFQRDAARLYDVLYSFSYFYEILSQNSDLEFGERLCQRLEKRWKEWEQPIIILS